MNAIFILKTPPEPNWPVEKKKKETPVKAKDWSLSSQVTLDSECQGLGQFKITRDSKLYTDVS